MKINPKYKVRNVSDENIVLVQGINPGDMTKVIALNDTSLFLWNKLEGREFDKQDVVQLLTGNYDVDTPQASRDAELWIAKLNENGVLLA